VTNEHMTETERKIREAFPDMVDQHVQNLRLLSVLKNALDKELADGTPPDSKGVKNIIMNMNEVVDAHVCCIAYYMGLSVVADDPESIIAVSLELATRLTKEIHGARRAYKEHLASGNDCGFEVIDANLMGQSSTARN
jgi:hemerythrin-like domain-containing protein